MKHNRASSQDTMFLQCWNKVHMEFHSNNCKFQVVYTCWKDSTGPALCIFLWSHTASFRLNIIQSQSHFMFSGHYTGIWYTICTRSIFVCSPNIIRWSNKEWDGQGMWHVWKTREVHTWSWCKTWGKEHIWKT